MVNIIFEAPDGEQTAVDALEGDTLMAVAQDNAIDGIAADCGGSMACGPCHIFVTEQWQQQLPKQSDIEKEMLEFVPDPQPNGRLSCQLKVTAELEGIVVKVPEAQY